MLESPLVARSSSSRRSRTGLARAGLDRAGRAGMRWPLALLGGLIVLSALLLALQLLFARQVDRDLDALLAVARGLKAGMTRAEVLDLASRHESPGLRRRADAEATLVLFAPYGLSRTCSLELAFRDGRLASAHARGEDGPQRSCPGAPPDLP